jgi:RNA polymerase sigma factor (sigma-70 family)
MPAEIENGQNILNNFLPNMSGLPSDRALSSRAMLLMDDMQLLQAYVLDGSEEAFKTILDRHINLVYSTALRQVGNPSLASDVTQTTFIVLAQKAPSLGRGTILAGWLYRTAQFAATKALRTEARRRNRENEAALMQTESSESIWEQLAPILDQAMAHLGAADRNALVLRYFENKTAKDVGLALGINESAAQKRLVRAIEKLRSFCTRKGVVLTGAALAGLLSANAVQAAPDGIAMATTTALKAGAVGGSTATLTSGTLKLIAWTKFKMAMLASLGVATVAVGTAVILHLNWSEPRFHDRALSAWLQQLDNGQQNFSAVLPWTSWQTQWEPSPTQTQAAEAIRAMGTHAVPSLIAMLEKTNLSPYDRLLGSKPRFLEDRHRQAAFALDALGPACKPWIPELTRILNAAQCPKEAAIALAAIGPEGWEVLTRATAGKGDTVPSAVWALGSHHASVPGTEEALLAVCKRNDPIGIDILSLWALTEINPDHSKFVPLLIQDLHSVQPDARWGAAVVLGHLGREAQSALPDLWNALQDRNATVRHDAAQAIEQIDPQAAARANLPDALANQHIPKTSIF